MKKSIKVLFISSVLFLTASCQDTLDTSSKQMKEHSIKQMMVGLHPHNQAQFNQALQTIYHVDQQLHTDVSIDEAMALTDQKLKGKNVVEILHLSFASKKINLNDIPKRADILATRSLVKNTSKPPVLIKTSLNAK